MSEAEIAARHEGLNTTYSRSSMKIVRAKICQAKRECLKYRAIKTKQPTRNITSAMLCQLYTGKNAQSAPIKAQSSGFKPLFAEAGLGIAIIIASVPAQVSNENYYRKGYQRPAIYLRTQPADRDDTRIDYSSSLKGEDADQK